MFGLARARCALQGPSIRSFLLNKRQPSVHSLVAQHRRNATATAVSLPTLFECRTRPIRIIPYGGGDIVAGIMAHKCGRNQLMFRHASSRTRQLDLPVEDWQVAVPGSRMLTYKIDPVQDLLVVMSEVDIADDLCELNLLTMSSGQPHPAATVPTLRISSNEAWPDNVVINGSLVCLQFGKKANSRIVIWNWKTGIEVYSGKHDFVSKPVLFEDKFAMLVHLTPPHDEARFAAITVIELASQTQTPRRWTFNLPTLREPGIQGVFLMSEPTIGAHHHDRIVSMQMNISLEGYSYTSVRIVTLFSKLKAFINADDAPSDGTPKVYPWSVWAPESARIFDWTYGHDDENGLHSTSGTRFVRHDYLRKEMRALDKEQHDLPSHLRRYAYPGAVEILDFGVTDEEIRQAVLQGSTGLPVGLLETGEKDYSGLVEGDTCVIKPTNLPNYAKAYFVDEDAAVPTGLPYRSRIRSLGFDRQLQDGEKASATNVFLERPGVLKKLYLMEVYEKVQADQEKMDRADERLARIRQLRELVGRRRVVRQGRLQVGLRKRPPVFRGRFGMPIEAIQGGEGIIQSMAHIPLSEESDQKSDEDEYKGRWWMGDRWKTFDKVTVTEESLVFVRNSWSDSHTPDPAPPQEWLVVDLTDKGIL